MFSLAVFYLESPARCMSELFLISTETISKRSSKNRVRTNNSGYPEPVPPRFTSKTSLFEVKAKLETDAKDPWMFFVLIETEL